MDRAAGGGSVSEVGANDREVVVASAPQNTCARGSCESRAMRSSIHLSRVLFRLRIAPHAVVIIHLERQLPAASSSQPTDSGESPLVAYATCPPTRPCSQWGLPCHLRYRKCGGLLPHRFTLTRRSLRRGGQTILCCTFLGVSATGRYPALHSMELGLSSRRFLRT